MFTYPADKKKLSEYAHTLHSFEKPVQARFGAMLSLRQLGSIDAIETLIMAYEYEPKSDLMRHELCYSLGQIDIQSPEDEEIIQSFLEKVILTGESSDFVRHEAIEALDFVSEELTMQLLENFKEGSTGNILFDTYYLKKRQMQWAKDTDNGRTEGLTLPQDSKFNTVDPAPFYNYKAEGSPYTDVASLQQILLNTQEGKDYDLFERYRALFTLRELNSAESVAAVCSIYTSAENLARCSDLLKHQAAFVIGQMKEVFQPAADILLNYINNTEQVAPIVFHEVLLCLGWILEDKAAIEKFMKHPDLIVSESCESAIDIIELRQAQAAGGGKPEFYDEDYYDEDEEEEQE